MDLVFVIVQILGIISLVLFVVSLQQRRKENLLLWQIAGTLLFVAQYVLSDRLTGALTFSVVAVRGLVFYIYRKKDLKPSVAVLVVFLAALLGSTIISWQNMLSVIPFLATAAKTWGTWQDDMKWTRRVSLLSQTIMIAYDLAAGMYTAALTEACNSVSTIVAMRRFDGPPRPCGGTPPRRGIEG